ncbi:MAG: hypothetical protein H6594_06825 [Flavobacteriales bacterium]|nr:hypothetical protein [Flavobacteriales bacterium]
MERLLVPSLLLLGTVYRTMAIDRFNVGFVSTDDAVSWHAATHVADGLFMTPYYYGQNYGPMLEALVAAPFTFLGIPMSWLMAIVPSLLTLLPFWSFALWHRKHGRIWAGASFAAMPLLLPPEFAFMTSMPRGFVTGLPFLALLPWSLDLRDPRWRSFLTGLAISLAWFANPNSVVFTAGYLCWSIIARHLSGAWRSLAIGLLPGVVLQVLAQHWCAVHPDRIIHHLSADRLSLHASLIVQGLSSLDEHFRWLMPLFPTQGGLAGISLVALIPIAILRRDKAVAFALLAAAGVIVASLGMPKTHDGWDWVYYPLSRMFVCLPLLLAWGVASLIRASRSPHWMAVFTLILGLFYAGHQWNAIGAARNDQLAKPQRWVGVIDLATMKEDAAMLRERCERQGAGLIVPLQQPSQVWAQLRAYLYPVLGPGSTPTYLAGYERRYWQRDAFADSVVSRIMFTGGERVRWDALRRTDPHFVRLMGSNGDAMYLLTGNTRPTDQVVSRVMAALAP